MPKEEIADLLRRFDKDGKGQVCVCVCVCVFACILYLSWCVASFHCCQCLVCASVSGQFDVDEFEAIITESLQAFTAKKDVGWYWEGGREV